MWVIKQITICFKFYTNISNFLHLIQSLSLIHKYLFNSKPISKLKSRTNWSNHQTSRIQHTHTQTSVHHVKETNQPNSRAMKCKLSNRLQFVSNFTTQVWYTNISNFLHLVRSLSLINKYLFNYKWISKSKSRTNWSKHQNSRIQHKHTQSSKHHPKEITWTITKGDFNSKTSTIK